MLFMECAEKWFAEYEQSLSSRKQRRAHFDRDIRPAFRDRLLSEITEDDVRVLCEQVKVRGAPRTASQILGIVRRIYIFAKFKGYKGINPTRFIANSSFSKPSPRNRSLSIEQIRVLYQLLGESHCKPYYGLAIRLLLLTLARRAELLAATWTEIDFESGVWNLPPGRAKAARARRLYLSRQALDILIQLKASAGRSEYIFPSPLDSFGPMAAACLSICTLALRRRAKARNLSLPEFAPSDLRLTGERALREMGFEHEWVEVAMAREVSLKRQGIRVSGVYAGPLRHMMQEWADMVDAWVARTERAPVLLPPPENSDFRRVERGTSSSNILEKHP